MNILPCPFCGASAERIDIQDGENAGGSCVQCTKCLASSNVEFGRKENFVHNWNARVSFGPDEAKADSDCREDDGCPTEKAVLQRFWREQHANLSANKNMGGASPMCACGEPMAPGVEHSTTKPCYVMGAEEMKGAWPDSDLKALTDEAFAADEEIMRRISEQKA